MVLALVGVVLEGGASNCACLSILTLSCHGLHVCMHLLRTISLAIFNLQVIVLQALAIIFQIVCLVIKNWLQLNLLHRLYNLFGLRG